MLGEIKNPVFITSSDEFKIISVIISSLEKNALVKFSNQEIMAFSEYVLGSHSYNFDYSYYENWIQLEILVNKLIVDINSKIDTNILGDNILFEGLLNHLKPAIYRIKQGIKLENAIYEEVLDNYPELFLMIKDSMTKLIHYLEVEINDACTRVLALHQPAAGDLRLIQIVIKTVSDLERIGNVARKIVRFVRKNREFSHIQPLYLHKMGIQAQEMLRTVLDAFARMDVCAAVQLYKEDDKIDEQYELLICELMNYMAEHPHAIPQVLEMIRCAHSIERIGDRCQNISDYIIYYIKGKDVRHTKIEHLTDLK